MDQQDQEEQVERLVSPALEEVTERQDSLDLLDHLDQMDVLDRPALLEDKVLEVLLERLDLRVHVEIKVQLDHKASREGLGLQEVKVNLDRQDLEDIKEILV